MNDVTGLTRGLILVNIMVVMITNTALDTPAIETLTLSNATPAAAYLASLSTDVGRAGMRSELAKVARLMGADNWQSVNWATLNAANVAALLAKVTGAPASRNKTRAALRGVARAAWRMNLITSEELARINDISGAKGSREAVGREIEAWEIAALIRTCAGDPSPRGARDGALLALAIKTGARREELANITTDNMTLNDGCYTIRVIGKGNKQRELYADNGACRALNDWMAIRGDYEGYLFVSIAKGDKLTRKGMSTTALHKILVNRAKDAELTNVSWHDFRRTYAGVLLDTGEDISTVAQLMGHSNVATTQRYDRRPAEARRKAARKVSVPYFERATT